MSANSEHETCIGCGLWKSCRTPFMKGTPGSDIENPIMFIGEAPGARDDFDGQQFVGQTGEVLWSAAKKAGIDIDQVYTQNAVRCAPPKSKLNGLKAINACRPFLFEEIDAVRPKAILVLGGRAFQSLFKKGGGLNKARRTKLHFALSDGTLIPTAAAYHPAYVLRNRNLKANFERDIRFFADMLTGKEKKISLEGANLDATTEDLLSLQRLWASQKISIAGPDCEGNTLKPYRDKTHGIIMCVALSDGTPKGTVVVRLDEVIKPFDAKTKCPGEYKLIDNDHPKVLALKALLEDPNIGKFNHNIKHDMHVLGVRFGIEVNNVVDDTLIHHALIYPMEGRHDLDEVASELLGLPKYKNQIEKFIGTGEEKKNPRRYERIPPGHLAAYAASDGIVTYKIRRRLIQEDAKLAVVYRELGLPGLKPSKFMQNIAIPGMIALFKMERRGIRVNKKHTQILIDELTERLRITETALQSLPTVRAYERAKRREVDTIIAGRKRPPTDNAKRILLEKNRLNINSGDQLNKILFDPKYFGVPQHVGTLTDGETRFKTSAEELNRIVSVSATHLPEETVNELQKFCELSIQFATYTTLKGTFATPVLEKFVDDKSRIHSSFNLGIARTGRLSSSEPNLQNIPSDDDDDPTRQGLHFRNLYIAPKNYVLMCPDYSQIELRVLAAISGDEGMIDIYRRGEDLHAETARAIYKLKRGVEIKVQQRRHAKTINFGIVYGIGAEGLAKQLGITLEQAQVFIDRWFERFPGVDEWQQRTKAFATKYGFVYTMTGRRRLLEDAKEMQYSDEVRGNRNEALRQAINAPVQGTASDICLVALTALDKTFDKLGEMLKIYLAGNVSTVHDQILMEVRENKVMSTAKVVKRIMTEHPLKFIGDQMNGVPIMVDFKVGKSWGEAKDLEVV